jgi:hypothetical protein
MGSSLSEKLPKISLDGKARSRLGCERVLSRSARWPLNVEKQSMDPQLIDKIFAPPHQFG